jgi:type I restriction enzyme, R subunit
MDQIDQREKTLVFCATQDHALAVRDLINQMKTSKDPNYCQRVTADDGDLGEQYLRDFQDSEKTIPTILTTSQKLSTGVDAPNIRNIVLMRPINSMIEFKQIIGRGTRLYDGKDYFTIYDFVKAHHHFSDPEWDGEPVEPEPKEPKEPKSPRPEAPEPEGVREPGPRRQKIRVKLADGKARTIQHMMCTTFWHHDGTPMSAQQFMERLFGKLPEFFKDEAELRAIWSAPKQQAFLDFVLSHYVSVGVDELDQEKLTPLLRLKYHNSIADAVADLGRPEEIGKVFVGFQRLLYQEAA